MITIIFGPPRIGKTALMVKILNDIAFDKERNRLMQSVIRDKNDNWGYRLTVPTHCVATNFEATFKKPGFKARQSRVIDPNRLGFHNDTVKTHYMLPYETYGIMEAQGYYNSRNFASFPEWKSNLFEQHGHNHLDFYLDTQRPGLIDVNIRDLANFIEVRGLNVQFKQDKVLGKLFRQMTWTVRRLDNSGVVDEYMKSGKRDKSLYTEERIISLQNVFNMYNSYSLEKKYEIGHENEDFDLQYSAQYLFDIKESA